MSSREILQPAERLFRSVLERTRSWGLLLPALAAFSVVWLSSFGFPAITNSIHLPIVLGYAQSAEGPHDAFHQTLSNFTSLFWLAVSLIATESNVRELFLVLLVVSSVVTVLAAYAFAVAAGASRTVAALGTALLAFAFGARNFLEFGSGELLSGYLTHSQFATALCLAAFAFALRRHWCIASGICGLAADMNLFLGFWAMANLMLARLAIDWQSRRQVPVLGFAAMAGACLLAASPTIVWALRTLPATQAADFSFVDFLYAYFPFHSFVHVQPGPFINFAVLSAAIWLCLRAHPRSSNSYAAGLLSITAFGTVLLGAALAYASDSHALQSFYPLRYAAVAEWIAAIGVLTIWSRAEEIDPQRGVYGAIAALGLTLSSPAVTLFGLLFLTNRFDAARRAGWPLIVGLVVSLIVPPWWQPVDFIPTLGPLPVIALVSVGGSAALALCGGLTWADRALLSVLLWLVTSTTLLSGTWSAVPFALVCGACLALRGTVLSRNLVAAICVTATIVMLALMGFQSTRGRVVAATLFLSLLPLLTVRAVRLRQDWGTAAIVGLGVMMVSLAGIAQGVRRSFDFPRERSSAWTDAQRWAREHTPADTLFYAPGRSDFATFSRRPVWWDRRQGAAVMWAPSFFKEWEARRIKAENVQDLAGLVNLARSESISFLVVRQDLLSADRSEDVVPRYCNEGYCVVEVTRPL